MEDGNTATECRTVFQPGGDGEEEGSELLFFKQRKTPIKAQDF